MTLPPEPTWVVVVPVKRGEIAKSRLTGMSADQRSALARAFPADCVEAALSVWCVRRVLVVTDDTLAAEALSALGAEVIADAPDAGLNPALRHASEHVRHRHPDAAVAALSGDLPALRTAELGAALARADRHPRAFVTDLEGAGTTLLTAGPGVDLEPRFGPTSRRSHLRTGAVELDIDGVDGLRRDVDTPSALSEAVRLGVGRHTRAVLDGRGIRLD